jgi:hypothetical protein
MANISAYAAKLALDFLLNTQTATRPTSRYVGLSYGSPTSVSGSEIASIAGYARQPYVAAAAASPGGSCSASGAISFAAATYASTVSGWQIWDNATIGSGNMLAQGLLSAATRPSSLSGFTFAAASIRITAL